MKLFFGFMIIIFSLMTENAFALSKKECKKVGKTLYLNVSSKYSARLDYTDCVSGEIVTTSISPGQTWNFNQAVLPGTTVTVDVLSNASPHASATNGASENIGNGLTILCGNNTIVGKACQCNGNLVPQNKRFL